MSDADSRRRAAEPPAPPRLRIVGGAAANGQVAPFGPADEALTRLADAGVPVLIRGERGTGKELAARVIHARSSRRARPFVKVACGAPPQLLEAELFGCERGVGGAAHPRPGRLEFASGGTLFLDEILDLPAPLQQRLHQVLEDRGFVRPGAHDAVHLNLRVVASTSGDAERAVAAGRFLEALVFRLNVVSLTLPPLRQRRTELPDLARFFLRQHAARFNRPEVVLSRETLRLLLAYPWPGNVHELGQRMQDVVIAGDDQALAADLAAWRARARRVRGASLEAESRPAAVSLKAIGPDAADAAERALICRTQPRKRWNRREAAVLLRVSYKALLYKIKKAELAGA
jgi:two-component system response regulator AtoC